MNGMKLNVTACSFPTREYPYYYVKVEFPNLNKDFKVERVEGNNLWIRDYSVYNYDVQNYNNILHANANSTMVARFDWENGSSNFISVALKADDGEEIVLCTDFTAPDEGGYWNKQWKYYASVVLTEDKGVARDNEPVHTMLGVYTNRLTSLEDEVRMVGIDPFSGIPCEVPCQIYESSSWSDFTDKHCQPTTTFDIAFLADVPANTGKVYLVFYGNPNASKPVYDTDLNVSGEGLDLTIDNSFYKARLHEKSGAIEEIVLKQGVNAVFDHHLETNGALHWNPGVYAPPRTWTHASDWDPPENYIVEKGPVFTMTKRWGMLPQYPEVLCSVTYIFYANNPQIIISSTLQVLKDIGVVALRNGEIVLNHNVVKEFAWEKTSGEIGTTVVKDRPRHPEMGLKIDRDTPWYALYNSESKAALGVVNVKASHMKHDGGLARVYPFLYLQWGPWVYVARPLIYTFISNNPQRVLNVQANNSYYEKMVLIPFKLPNKEEKRFELMKLYKQKLSEPLRITTCMDTDERVPTEWVPPILLEEFEEL